MFAWHFPPPLISHISFSSPLFFCLPLSAECCESWGVINFGILANEVSQVLNPLLTFVRILLLPAFNGEPAMLPQTNHTHSRLPPWHHTIHPPHLDYIAFCNNCVPLHFVLMSQRPFTSANIVYNVISNVECNCEGMFALLVGSRLLFLDEKFLSDLQNFEPVPILRQCSSSGFHWGPILVQIIYGHSPFHLLLAILCVCNFQPPNHRISFDSTLRHFSNSSANGCTFKKARTIIV